MDELLELAAELLPEGWQIKIEVERHAASATLHGPHGFEKDMHMDETKLSLQFRAAILSAQMLDAESRNIN